MQSLTGASPLVLVLLLQLVPAQISQPPEEGYSRVMAFQEVWAKSMCRPMEQLVDVEQEYPGEVEYIYLPACVPLLRCSGCCGDENMECKPTLERNITLQVYRIRPMIVMQQVELTFVEHQTCECSLRPPQQLLNDKSSGESIKTRPRRRKHKKTASGCGKSKRQRVSQEMSLHTEVCPKGPMTPWAPEPVPMCQWLKNKINIP